MKKNELVTRKAVMDSVTKEYNARFREGEGLKLAYIEKAVNDAKDENASHSERDILDACIKLMKRLTDEFDAYLDMVVGPDADLFRVRTSYFDIVQALFLMRTDHSGGTSTRAKCKELGVDPSENIIFEAGNVDEDE